MSLFVLGINHKTAPVSLREKVAFTSEYLKGASLQLAELPFVLGSVILSTCNRMELYVSTANEDNISQKLTEWLCTYHQLDSDELSSHIYCYENQEMVNHLMTVACGLDSLILGEPQILGQVKQSFAQALQLKTVSSDLNRLFQRCFAVAKRVRTETEIGSSAVSIAFAACLLARQLFESMSELTILLIGAGNMIELIARYLNSHQVKRIIIANRNLERAEKLAENMSAEPICLSELNQYLHEADIIFSCTGSSKPILDKNSVIHSAKLRHYQPALFIDIAVPRDIDPTVATISGCYLYTIDDLQSIIVQNMAQRQIAAQQAQIIIRQEVNEFMLSLQGQGAVDTICAYRQQAEFIRDDLVKQALKALEHQVNAEQVIEALAYKLTNRLIHAPTKSLRETAQTGELQKLRFLRSCLGLDKN